MKVRCSRRIISGLLLLWLGLLQFPLPLALRAAGSSADGKDHSTPFPCMNRPCGCRSAEECWTNCCCTTKAERIAFVLEHGLEMPDALMDGDEEAAPPRSCCSTRSKAAGCDSSECSTGDEHCAKCQDQSRDRKLVLFDSAMKCKGLNSLLLQFAGALVPVPELKQVAAAGWEVSLGLVDDLVAGISLAPPSPPPRIGG